MRTGEIVAGRFEIRGLAATGGTSRVFRAWDAETNRDVALKVVRRPEGETFARFFREATMLAVLRHPAIVSYVGHRIERDGESWLATEWLDGSDLEHLLGRGVSIDDSRRLPRCLAIRDAAQIGQRVASALSDMHRIGLVHRDVTPANIVLVGGDPDGATLIDFGAVDTGPAPLRITKAGALVGTPLYMAPEQARGQRGVGAPADVWALGCILYEALTGVSPFEADHLVAVLARITLDDPVDLVTLRPEVPDELDSLVRRMLSKQPSERPTAKAAETLLAELVTRAPSKDRGARRPTTSIGRSEQRIDAVVLSGPCVHRTADALDRVHACAERHGGEVSTLDDVAFAVSFSSNPANGAEIAERAARTALALRDAVPGVPLAVLAERREVGMPLGHSYDVALRMLDVSDAGRIVVNDATAELLERRFQLVRFGPVHELVRERDTAEPPRTLLGRPTECVGRERELAWLEALVGECIDEPRARVAMVSGPAGIGKSRLRQELVGRVRALHPDVTVLYGVGDMSTAGSPYAILSRAIRTAADLDSRDAIEAQREKLCAFVDRIVASADQRRHTAAFLGELADVPFPPEFHPALRTARRDATVRTDSIAIAFQTLLEGLCASGPVMLALEDIRWGDAPSFAVIDVAIRALERQPLFVLTSVRPEARALFPRLFEGRAMQELRLERLSRKAASRLVRSALPDLDDATLSRLVERADGNPFFLEELVRAVASGVATRSPRSVLAVLEGRLDELGEPRKTRAPRGERLRTVVHARTSRRTARPSRATERDPRAAREAHGRRGARAPPVGSLDARGRARVPACARARGRLRDAPGGRATRGARTRRGAPDGARRRTRADDRGALRPSRRERARRVVPAARGRRGSREQRLREHAHARAACSFARSHGRHPRRARGPRHRSALLAREVPGRARRGGTRSRRRRARRRIGVPRAGERAHRGLALGSGGARSAIRRSRRTNRHRRQP